MKPANKSKSVRAVPEGFATVTPFLVLDDAIGFIEFLKKAFDGQQTFMHKTEDGKVMHATVKIGNTTLMLAEIMEGMEPQTGMFYLYLENADDTFQKALKAKATEHRALRDEFYGDRAGAVKDKWGNIWWIATHIEDVDREELERRSKEVLAQHREHELHK